ncbi:MAG TPA: SRPBCC domain-containing protein [Terriglobales bacterium]|nr:SRPBCC domain-containing protein [Terriglobales bacterium]
MKLEDLMLDLVQHIEIKAPPKKVFPMMLEHFGQRFTTPEGQPLQTVLEPKPGGRWYRDRGDGIGHLWGFVQVIKPPSLLELSGPMFMSYPATNHIEVKIEEVSGGSKVTLRHRALGMIDPEHRKGVSKGWNHMLASLKKDCE